MFDLVNGFVVNGWDRDRAIEAISNRATVPNEWYVLVFDIKAGTGDYDNIEFTDAKTAYETFDRMKDTIPSGKRLEIIWSADSSDETVKDLDNVVVYYYLG